MDINPNPAYRADLGAAVEEIETLAELLASMIAASTAGCWPCRLKSTGEVALKHESVRRHFEALGELSDVEHLKRVRQD